MISNKKKKSYEKTVNYKCEKSRLGQYFYLYVFALLDKVYLWTMAYKEIKVDLLLKFLSFPKL